MKIFFLFTILSSFSLTALAAGCEVYGISDSPQALVCKMGSKKVIVSCREGEYFLDDEKVDVAFHFEVEEGPTPLVFRTKTRELVVTVHSETRMSATLSGPGPDLSGNCR